MSAEEHDFEWQEQEPRVDVLIIDMAERAIQSMADVYHLQDEVESIREDYPEFKIVIFKLP